MPDPDTTAPRTSRFSSMTWLVPYLAVVVADGVARPLEHWQGVATAAFVACAIGLAAGVLWYSLHPRPLAQRLNGLAGLWALMVALFGLVAVVHLFGGNWRIVHHAVTDYSVLSIPSVLAGLVFAEVGERPSLRSIRSRRSSVPVTGEQHELRHSDLGDHTGDINVTGSHSDL